MAEEKAIQDEVVPMESDPEQMTIEEDGQEAFDQMWVEGDTVTEDGYV